MNQTQSTRINLSPTQTIRVRWAIEALSNRAQFAVKRVGPWTIYLQELNLNNDFVVQITHAQEPELCEVRLSGYTGWAEGKLGLLEELLSFCSKNLSRN